MPQKLAEEVHSFWTFDGRTYAKKTQDSAKAMVKNIEELTTYCRRTPSPKPSNFISNFIPLQSYLRNSSYAYQDICVKRRKYLEFGASELIRFEVFIPNFKLLICAVYRQPGNGTDFWNSFDYSIEQALNFTKNVLITDDLNVDLLTECNHRRNEIIQYNMTNIIEEPTRFGPLLDPILISNDNISIDIEVIQVDRAISDHDATLVHLKIPFLNKKSYTRNVWLYKHAEFISLNGDIDNYDWEVLLSERFTHKYL
ncbi:unnamed protein product [Mytilus coruscus]|uniref:Endonuclease/exonuclease/phosphatase domain-containing protein n=1 Tax=Mytilus coruscus TaxID=42192 RepID=A0A6J8AP61_MYTCO|nr:unnamed protein product [Mytilus coruscus]